MARAQSPRQGRTVAVITTPARAQTKPSTGTRTFRICKDGKASTKLLMSPVLPSRLSGAAQVGGARPGQARASVGTHEIFLCPVANNGLNRNYGRLSRSGFSPIAPALAADSAAVPSASHCEI